jgi:phosphonoacetate hydrolase
MLSTVHKVIGTSASRHDLAALKEPLRSHGGLNTQAVPFIVNRVLPELPEAPTLRNFDAFHYATLAARAGPVT